MTGYTWAVSTTRELVHGLVAGAAAGVPVYRWLPGHTDELPCYVVGRPNGREGDRAAMARLEIPVYALGRTLRDDEAQAELDRMVDTLVAALWKPSPTEGVTVRLTEWEATVMPVAELEIPAYTTTVVASTVYC